MPKPYIPASLAELYDHRAKQQRKELRLQWALVVLYFVGAAALYAYLWWHA